MIYVCFVGLSQLTDGDSKGKKQFSTHTHCIELLMFLVHGLTLYSFVLDVVDVLLESLVAQITTHTIMNDFCAVFHMSWQECVVSILMKPRH
jgi:hypothetical protein